jgi:hypothetical protein
MDYCLISHKKIQEKSWYGLDSMLISTWVVLVGIVADDAKKSFNKFAPPPYESKNESASKSQRTLFKVWSWRILLNIFGVRRIGFFPSVRTGINLHFELNLHARKETISLKLKASRMQMAFTRLVVQILLARFFSGKMCEYHWYAVKKWKYLFWWARELTMYPRNVIPFFF